MSKPRPSEVKGYRRNWDCGVCGHPVVYLILRGIANKVVCSCGVVEDEVSELELRSLWHPLREKVLLWSCGCITFTDREGFFINPCSPECPVLKEILRQTRELGHKLEIRGRT